MATTMQAVGTMLTAMGQAEAITDKATDESNDLRTTAAKSPEHAQGALSEVVTELLEGFAPMAEQALLARNEDNTLMAIDFIVQRARAAQARAIKEQRSDDKGDTNGEGRSSGHQMEPSAPGTSSQRAGLNGVAVPREQQGPPSSEERATRACDHGGHRDDGNLVLGESKLPERWNAVYERIFGDGNRPPHPDKPHIR